MKNSGFYGLLLLIIILIFVSCDFFYFDNPLAAASSNGYGRPYAGNKESINISIDYNSSNFTPLYQDMVYCPGRSAISGTGKGFWIGTTEITEQMYYTVWCNQSTYLYILDDSLFTYTAPIDLQDLFTYYSSMSIEPMVGMGVANVVVWCNLLSEMNGLEPVYVDSSNYILDDHSSVVVSDIYINPNANGYRLPTIEEWETAASFIDGYTWTDENWAAGAHYLNSAELEKVAVSDNISFRDVGTKRPTTLGLYDMSGNAYDFVAFNDKKVFNGSTYYFKGGYYSSANDIEYAINNTFAETNFNSNYAIRLCRNEY